MTNGEIAEFVAAKVGLTDSDSVNLCSQFANRRYQMIYDRENWVDALRTDSVALVANQSVYSLPSTIERIVTLTIGGNNIEPATLPFLQQSFPELIGASGQPKFYIEST